MHRKERNVEANEGKAEVQPAKRLAHEAPGELREPVVHAPEQGEHSAPIST